MTGERRGGLLDADRPTYDDAPMVFGVPPQRKTTFRIGAPCRPFFGKA